MISIVIPIFKSPKILPELVKRLQTALSQMTKSFEVLLVDDGCPCDSWSVIEELSFKHAFIKGIKLSRNFGQHYAITAGLDHAKGDWVVVMDCDLQDQPEEIHKLYYKALKGYDIVLAAREKRKDNSLKKLFSKLFYSLLSYLSGAKYDHRVANFGIYSKKVITAINQFREPIRYFPGLVQYVGFKTTTINIKHASREEGKTSYSLMRLIKLALDVILAYSDKPLRMIIKLGLLISLISFGYVAYSLWQWYHDLIVVQGYTSLIASVWFLSGVLISTLGVIALYLGKTFEAVKSRPIYLIEKALL
jgi:glycosyltransferase involved in cell wall biosynthesis